MPSRSCPGCGAGFELPEYVGDLAWLNTTTAYCDECAAEKTAAMEREAIREECRKRYFEGIRRGLLTEQFRRASFAVSLPDVEALNPDAWRMGREWRRETNLYIMGHIGTGKTFLALCALRKAFVAGLDVAETTARQFVKTSDLFKDSENLFPAWKRVDVLLLDDIDKARWNLDRIDALWELLNSRMAAQRKTIITGNINLHDLNVMMRERTGDGERDVKNTARADAALDRLKPCTTIELKGKSLR